MLVTELAPRKYDFTFGHQTPSKDFHGIGTHQTDSVSKLQCPPVMLVFVSLRKPRFLEERIANILFLLLLPAGKFPVLLLAHIKRFSVSRRQDFSYKLSLFSFLEYATNIKKIPQMRDKESLDRCG